MHVGYIIFAKRLKIFQINFISQKMCDFYLKFFFFAFRCEFEYFQIYRVYCYLGRYNLGRYDKNIGNRISS